MVTAKKLKKVKKGEIKNIDDMNPNEVTDKKLKKYLEDQKKFKEHKANTPTVDPDASLKDKVKNRLAIIKHNMTGPQNPNMIGGTVGNGLIGGGGAVKKGIKLGAKAIKVIRKKLKDKKQ